MGSFSLNGRRVWVAGSSGMAGGAILRRLERENCNILTSTRLELDLRRQTDVNDWFADKRPEVVFLAAGTVGGILANSQRPADFIYDNLAMETNIIHAAWRFGVTKLLFLGSSCIYPRNASQPMTEEMLLSGSLEPTNEWYAVAKIAGIKMCQAFRRQHGCDFISVMPTNLYGPGDRYHLKDGHVVAALIMKIHDAKLKGISSVEVWGSGRPKREFLFSEDLADACIFVMKNYSGEPFLNIGSNCELTIRELAELIANVIGWDGELVFNSNFPDGVPRKIMDTGRLTDMGWVAQSSIETGMRKAYDWYLKNVASQ